MERQESSIKLQELCPCVARFKCPLRLLHDRPMTHIMGVHLHIHNPWTSLCKLKLVLLCANELSCLLDIVAEASSSQHH